MGFYFRLCTFGRALPQFTFCPENLELAGRCGKDVVQSQKMVVSDQGFVKVFISVCRSVTAHLQI